MYRLLRERGQSGERRAQATHPANKKLKARNERLAGELGKTKAALDIAGKAFALLEDISNSADSGQN